MATLTLRLPASAPAERAGSARRPGFWRRAFNAMMEARMRQAEAEVARHVPTFTRPTKQDRVGVKEFGALPSVR
jgi:hypothetical protein